MSDKREIGQADQSNTSIGSSERVVYVMRDETEVSQSNNEIDLRALGSVVWAGKWWILASTAFFIATAFTYASLATEWYRVEVLLAPADEMNGPSFGGQLGGLAAL